MLPFDLKKIKERQTADKSTKCSQQALANRLVMNSFPQQTNAQPIQQQPVKQ